MRNPMYAQVRIGRGLYRWDLRFTPFHREVIRIGRSIRIGVYIFGILVHHTALPSQVQR